MTTQLRPLGPLLVILALGACAHGERVAPVLPLNAVELPSAWVAPDAAGAMAMPAPTREWWRGFKSAELSELLVAASTTSPDLAIAVERVRQAEAQVRIADASLFPALNIGVATAGRETRPQGGAWVGNNGSSAVLSASYEIDFWGRTAAAVRSSEALLRATRFDHETLHLVLQAGVANGYFQLLSLRGRQSIARQNLDIAERVFQVVDARVRNGAASSLDLARQRAALLTLRAAMPSLELQERQTLYALAILAGRLPEGFDLAGQSVSALGVPGVGPGLPALLLTRRPDIGAAEAQLEAASANLGAARAALLPSIGLTGSAGLASNVLVNFLNAPTAALSLGASMLAPIFDGGRLRGQVDVAASRELEMVELYRKSILAGFADAEIALSAVGRTADQEFLQGNVLEQARIALKLAEIRYREGVDDLLIVLDAQRSLFQAEDQLAQVRLARLQASVGLFTALGGGWQR